MPPPKPSAQSGISLDERQKRRKLQADFNANRTDVAVMDLPTLLQLHMTKMKSDGKSKETALQQIKALIDRVSLQDIWENVEGFLSLAKSWTPTVLDGKLLTELAYDMSRNGSIFSKYVVKEMNGKKYVIFKGYAGLRRLIKSTRYLASGTKLASLGIGKVGSLKSVKGGMVISLFLCAGFRAIEQLLDDTATWHTFIGGLASDLAKVAVAGAASMIAASLVSAAAGVGTVAIGPLFAAVAVGVVVGLTLDFIDEKTGFTEALINGMREAESNLNKSISEFQREYRWYTRTPAAEYNFWMRMFAAF